MTSHSRGTHCLILLRDHYRSRKGPSVVERRMAGCGGDFSTVSNRCCWCPRQEGLLLHHMIACSRARIASYTDQLRLQRSRCRCRCRCRHVRIYRQLGLRWNTRHCHSQLC
ncbi:unnamed protein product [Musa acuminata subsp. burmannicoides]